MRKHKRTSISIPKSSLVLELQTVFNARNIQYPHSFLIKIGMSAGTATKMLRGNAVQINLKQLTALCQNLNCTPNDLFARRELPVAQNHELNVIREYFPDRPEPTIEEWMLGKSISEIRELLAK